MLNTYTGLEVFDAEGKFNVEKYAEILLEIIEDGIKNPHWERTSGESILLASLQGSIALQLEIYRELKRDLTKIGNQT